jgi:pSer/pThr/pTyr-binding forkhead associated (FHA) protein
MAAPLPSSAGKCVFIHLLDANQGHPLQTWPFADRDVISIGRSDENDIVIVDPQVSRNHVRLVLSDGVWALHSIGRHGTLIDDRVVSEAKLEHLTVFRLGAGGPMLRFDTMALPQRRSETIDNFNADILSILEVDEARTQHEVNQIAENDLFRQLQEQSRLIKAKGNPTDRS